MKTCSSGTDEGVHSSACLVPYLRTCDSVTQELDSLSLSLSLFHSPSPSLTLINLYIISSSFLLPPYFHF